MLLRWQALGFLRFSTIKKNAITALASDGAGALQELVNSRNNREAVLITRGKKQGEPPPPPPPPWHLPQYLPLFSSPLSTSTELDLAPLSPGDVGDFLFQAENSVGRTEWVFTVNFHTSNDKGERHTNYLIIYIHFTMLQQVKKKLFPNYMTLRNLTLDIITISLRHCNAVYW